MYFTLERNRKCSAALSQKISRWVWQLSWRDSVSFITLLLNWTQFPCSLVSSVSINAETFVHSSRFRCLPRLHSLVSHKNDFLSKLQLNWRPVSIIMAAVPLHPPHREPAPLWLSWQVEFSPPRVVTIGLNRHSDSVIIMTPLFDSKQTVSCLCNFSNIHAVLSFASCFSKLPLLLWQK